MAAAVALRPPWCPSPGHRRIQQLANMLRDKSTYVIKTRQYHCFYYVFISYFRHDALILNAKCLSVCGLRQRAALRVSYSQRAVLRV